MDRLRQYLRAFGTLPAAVLVVFLAAQVELAGHLHAADDPVGDCAQCQHYNGHAVVSSGAEAPLPAPAVVSPDQPPVAAPVVPHYRRQARGPPALSC
jgi:hypothetical protein